ncbi:acyl-CoA dehydrogenase family protein [Cryobacterium sp. PH29-G1]|uniref:acyl-CoA dehydrogenase family protein n=1 Tax=Cryobacterium sp. PH29-G1 TaxID=3046211 RepID=UPI0024BA754A|nr:acyl-CoA dehydrogenase family protein [Cryobacterium sp. PH29-G1]MDJ0347933.1 acyl-CoA dehydrogenase family protein [Cryobacterium sp. PH29-G1]
MKQLYTERQKRFLALADQLVERFRDRAAANDADNTFPFQNYEDMRDVGLLNLSVPEELGGLGATLFEVIPVVERIASADAATALAVNMHFTPLAQWSNVWRKTKSPRLEGLLREAAEGKLIWAAITSEFGTPNLMTDARTRAEKVEGGYRITGRKNFGTNSAVATHASTTARFEDPEKGPQLLMMKLDLKDPNVRIHNVWNMMGMRATQSNDLEFDGVFVPDADVVHSFPVGHLDATVTETVFGSSQPAFGAVYVGIAVGGLDWAKQQVRRRGLVDDARAQDCIADAEILIETARALLYRHTHQFGTPEYYNEFDLQEIVAGSALVKHVCATNAVAVFTRLIDVVGGAAYAKSLPFERMWRDVQAGQFMPVSSFAAHEFIAATSLGLVLAPTHGSLREGVNA